MPVSNQPHQPPSKQHPRRFVPLWSAVTTSITSPPASSSVAMRSMSTPTWRVTSIQSVNRPKLHTEPPSTTESMKSGHVPAPGSSTNLAEATTLALPPDAEVNSRTGPRSTDCSHKGGGAPSESELFQFSIRDSRATLHTITFARVRGQGRFSVWKHQRR